MSILWVILTDQILQYFADAGQLKLHKPPTKGNCKQDLICLSDIESAGKYHQTKFYFSQTTESFIDALNVYFTTETNLQHSHTNC